MSSTARASAASLRAASMTRAPRFAAIRAVTSPIPLEAPVMTSTCSSIRFNRSPMDPLPVAGDARHSAQPTGRHAGARRVRGLAVA